VPGVRVICSVQHVYLGWS